METNQEQVQELEAVVEECPVCLSKTVATESLPYLADLMRSKTSEALAEYQSGNSPVLAELKDDLSEIKEAVRLVRDTIDLLKQCDCGGDEPLPEVEPYDDDLTRAGRFYDV